MTVIPGLLSIATGLYKGYDEQRKRELEEEERERQRQQQEWTQQIAMMNLISRPEFQAIGMEPNPLTVSDLQAGRTTPAQTPPSLMDLAGAMTPPGGGPPIRYVPNASADALNRYRQGEEFNRIKDERAEKERAQRTAFDMLVKEGVLPADMEYSPQLEYTKMLTGHLSSENIAGRSEEAAQRARDKDTADKWQEGKEKEAEKLAWDLAAEGRSYEEINKALGAQGLDKFVGPDTIFKALEGKAKMDRGFKSAGSTSVEKDWIEQGLKDMGITDVEFPAVYGRAKALDSDLKGARNSWEQKIVLVLATTESVAATLQAVSNEARAYGKSKGWSKDAIDTFAEEEVEKARTYMSSLTSAWGAKGARDAREYFPGLQFEPVQ